MMLEENLLRGLNDTQREASEALEGAVLVLAGAGSGKTRVLTTRLALLVNSGVAPYRILAVTFTNKAASEMKERLSRLIGEEQTAQLWIGTFHAISLRILKMFGDRIGFDDFSVLGADESMQLVKNLLKNIGIDTKILSAKMVLWQIEQWKNDALSPDKVASLYQQNSSLVFGKSPLADHTHYDLYIELYATYQRELKSLNAMDFGDLLLYSLQLFHDFPDVLAQFSQRFYSISVDEYQDSNTIQRLWILALGGHHGNVFCVGDEDQSIYGWRGASIDNILAFPKDFSDTKIYRLEQNYRSSGYILGAASKLIAHNKKRYDKTLWTASDFGEKVDVFCAKDGMEEAYLVATAIEKANTDLAKAILVRATYQTRILEEVLIRKGISYQIVGSVRFYERAEIRDMIAYLRFIAKPADRLAFERAIAAPKRGIGPAALQKITNWAEEEDCSFTDILEKCVSLREQALERGIHKALLKFLDQVENWRRQISDQVEPTVLLSQVLADTSYLEMLEKTNDPTSLESRKENLNELKSSLKNYVTLDAFLDQVSLMSDLAPENQQHTVSVMTIHAAKGLEFDEVFLPGWETDVFPSKRTLLESGDEGLEEERRLAYVALTRAKSKVRIFYAMQRTMYGTSSFSMPSQFLTELPKDCCHFDRKIASAPSYGYPSQGTKHSNSVTINRGTSCYHKRFGEGTVVHIDQDLVTVSFDDPSIGSKVVLARFLSFNEKPSHQ